MSGWKARDPGEPGFLHVHAGRLLRLLPLRPLQDHLLRDQLGGEGQLPPGHTQAPHGGGQGQAEALRLRR